MQFAMKNQFVNQMEQMNIANDAKVTELNSRIEDLKD